MVPTVERGLRLVDFWSIDTAGDSPSMKSTSGLSTWPRNIRAYEDRDSTYRRWPSAKIVSKAKEDFPEPDRPVKTIMESRGRSTLTFWRLCSRAPLTTKRDISAERETGVADSESVAGTDVSLAFSTVSTLIENSFELVLHRSRSPLLRTTSVRISRGGNRRVVRRRSPAQFFGRLQW